MSPKTIARRLPSALRIGIFLLIVLPLMIAANIAVWSAIHQPRSTQGWTGEIVGFAFSPFQAGQNPEDLLYPSAEEIRRDLQVLGPKAQAIRTYETGYGFDKIPEIAAEFDLSVALGAWIGRNEARNEQEIARLTPTAFRRNVVRVVVGNEALLRRDVTVDELISYIRRVKKTVWKPVSTAEPWHVWLDHPELVKEVDYLAVHILPYWEGVSVDKAVDYVFDRIGDLRKAYPGKPIVVTEVGWPSRGRIIPRRSFAGISEETLEEEAVPSLVNQAKFMRTFLNRAKDAEITYYVMEAFDQPWKANEEGAAGGYWGIYDVMRAPKFPMSGGVVEYTDWRFWAAIAAGLSLIPAVLLLLGRRHMHPAGQIFFAALVQLGGAAIAWSALSFSGIYLTPGQTVAWSVLFAAQGLLLVVLITEAVELVEALWGRTGKRHEELIAHLGSAADHLPKVSIHVPIHNEPPHMVRETLAALARLDYPDFEVLVIDNNTKDPEVWKPVEAECARLGERFRFFHLDPWPGYKAGALNFARSQTAEDADVIAVIDSDYQVSPDWLKTLCPHFADPDVGFVQAPQDYRDAGQSLFKTMTYWEYAGFFHIGMVLRDRYNAVIQHGTMTMVRKTALDEVGGWAEWCICEDAELGLKLYRAGYGSVYVNRSFGKGLTPDTLGAYMTQRFRWAYGAVQIMKHHLRAFLPGSGSGLNAAQKYYFFAGWLPWFADALALAFTAASIAVSAWALWSPEAMPLPVAAFMVPTIGSFLFKVIRSLWLYLQRVRCGLGQSLGAALAALALTHTVAKAVAIGMVTSGRPFVRTPKCEDRAAFSAIFIQVRDEAIMLAVLWGLGIAFLFHPMFQDSLSRLWVAVLAVQSLPYLASVLTSVISILARERESQPVPAHAAGE